MDATSSEPFRRSLDDVMRWCAALPFTSLRRDSPEVSHIRVLYERATVFLESARREAGCAPSGWMLVDTEPWKSMQRLLEKIRMASGPVEKGLRSDRLRPKFPSGRCPTDNDWAQSVCEVLATRSQIFRSESPVVDLAFAEGGRLLLYFPQENLACGAAQVSSGGFYDADNVPPWDLWVAYADRAVWSWVPPALIEVAQLGIDANPEQCIQWASCGVSTGCSDRELIG
jgi:hypothetical protein